MNPIVRGSRVARGDIRDLCDQRPDDEPVDVELVPRSRPAYEASARVEVRRVRGVVAREQIPNWAAQLKAMYDAWMENIDALRAELGDEVADDLVDEAHTVGPTLSRRTGVMYMAEKRGRANYN